MLGAEMQSHLISTGLCTKKEQCNQIATIYRRDGKYIEMNLYAASDEVIQEIFGFVAANGLRITKGKPIILNAFPKPKENYVNSFKGRMENRKPPISLRLGNDT